MAKKDRRTKAQLLAALNRADRAVEARVKAIKEDMQSLRDDRTRTAGELHNAKTALAELEAQNTGLTRSLETQREVHSSHIGLVESTFLRQTAFLDGRAEGQEDALLKVIELLLDRSDEKIDSRELI